MRLKEPKICLVNPSNVCAQFGVVTPAWIARIAGATPLEFQNHLVLIDEAIEQLDITSIAEHDLVGFSIHTLNAKRAYQKIEIIRRQSRATIVIGGVHATIFPEEALAHADAVVTGDGDLVWSQLVHDFFEHKLKKRYDGGHVAGELFANPRWDLMRHERYMWTSVSTAKGCPENCTFCSVWITDGRNVRMRTIDNLIEEIRHLYALGFRFFLLADDNFYAVGKKNTKIFDAIMTQRYALMEKLAALPNDIVFFTQTTIRTAEDQNFMQAMQRAHIHGVLIGIEAVEVEGLNAIHKEFNLTGEELIASIRRMQNNKIYVLGSFIVGLSTDTPKTFPTMANIANRSGMAFAQFVKYMPFPGTVDYANMLKNKHPIKLTRPNYWLESKRGNLYQHPNLSEKELYAALAFLWHKFYALPAIFRRARSIKFRKLKSALLFIAISKLYKMLYYEYGISADSAKTIPSNRLIRSLGTLCLALFKRKPTL